MEEIIEKLKQEARDSWSGNEGEVRAKNLEEYLRKKLKEYSEKLGIEEEKILIAWEENRDYSAINYYQDSNQPNLSGKNVRIFDTVEDLQKSIKEYKFRCPACEGISSDPYECDCITSEGKKCDWKVYGLLGDLGKGVYIYCKDRMIGQTIFTPICWE